MSKTPLQHLEDEADAAFGVGVAVELHETCGGWCAKVWPKKASDTPIMSVFADYKVDAIRELRARIKAGDHKGDTRFVSPPRARLDADRTAKPKTRIVSTHAVDPDRTVARTIVSNPGDTYVDEHGHKTWLR